MKQYTHAWLSLRAMKLLEDKMSTLPPDVQKYTERFLGFIKSYPSTFVRGAWFPDSVISDNLQGGHTWKYEFSDTGRVNNYLAPDFNTCKTLIPAADFDKPLNLVTSISALPDRCEALSQSIRDMIKIYNSLKKGDVIAFNFSQVAIFFLMLSHYTADAHMPLHCDARDFNDPSTVHPDMEDIWEKEALKYYEASKKYKQFDLDQDNNLRLINAQNYGTSFLSKIDTLLNNLQFTPKSNKIEFDMYLGNTNKNIWDYLVGVCHVSFLTSTQLLPIGGPYDYKTIKIEQESNLYNNFINRSPNILADAIASIAIVWLSTWMRWELL
ncbi:MAG: hypothetical protein Q8868_12195 [Bacteroidota bacterium]|nr:hypothetical protein [Bacteroidota bacterium]